MPVRGLRDRLPENAPAVVVLLIALAGLVRVSTANWREGAVLLGGSLLVAAVLRTALPADRAGLLAIRSRVVDVLCYLVLGLAVIALAVTITDSLVFG